MKTFLFFALSFPLIVIAKPVAIKEGYRKKMQESMSAFMGCYNEGLKANPNLEGKIILDWEILGTGVVQNARVAESVLNDPIVETCILSKLKELKFPKGRKKEIAHIRYPLVFSKGK